MRLTRIFVDEDLNSGGVVELARDSAAHVAKVLRARSGDELVLFNGDGREFTGAIEAVKGSRVFASIGAARSVDRESPFKVTLVQCVPRGDRMDFIVQKATELGVERIVPVLSQRSVVRLDPAQAASKQTHWRAVAISACEQCGRNLLPVVEAPLPPDMAAFWASLAIRHWLARQIAAKQQTDAAAATTVSVLGFFAQLALWSLVVLLALENLGFNITTLLAGLGIGGVAMALAAQGFSATSSRRLLSRSTNRSRSVISLLSTTSWERSSTSD